MTNKTDCACSLSIRLCGDGCKKCQPETYIFNLESALQSAEQEVEQLRSEIESLKKAQQKNKPAGFISAGCVKWLNDMSGMVDMKMTLMFRTEPTLEPYTIPFYLQPQKELEGGDK